MSYTKNERADYNLHRDNVCRGLGITHNQYNYLRRLANKLHALYERVCNEDFDSEPEENALIDAIHAYNDKHNLGMSVYFQGDPRGATLYAIEARNGTLDQSNYNQGYCIY